MARAPHTYLQLHLSDAWLPRTGSDTPARWCRRSGVRVEDGAAPLRDIAPADEIVVVVPATRVAFVRTTLPALRGAALAKALPFAVEDAVFAAPEDLHAVVMARAADGESLVAVVDRGWFEGMLETLREEGLPPARVVAESAFVAAAQGEWTVVWSERGGFLCVDGPETMALDAAPDGAPPVTLRLALQEARRSATGPAAIRLYTTSALTAPDAAAWSRSLRVPVTAHGRWAPESQDARRIDTADLLGAAQSGATREPAALRRYAPALAIGGLALAAHVGLAVADWARLALEERALRSAMTAQFRTAFPGAQVVDPALQMRRNLADLARAAAEPGRADALPLLAEVAAPLAGAGQRIRAVRYDAGRLEIDLPASSATSSAALQAAVRSRAPDLRVSAVADAPRGVTTLRIAPGDR